MPVKLTDKVYNEGGSPVQGAIAQAILTDGTATSVAATDTTDSKGIWAFDSAIAGHQADLADPAAGFWYDVRINVGMQYRLRYGAIKAMMNMVYLAQNIVLSASQTFDASLATVKMNDPVVTGQVILATGAQTLPTSAGNAGKWRYYKAWGGAMTIAPFAGQSLVAPGLTSQQTTPYSSPNGESTSWYCHSNGFWYCL